MLITQPSLRQISGQATDINIHAKEILRLRSHLSAILSKHTGQDLERIERDIERDLILTPKQALEYGLIDTVLLLEWVSSTNSFLSLLGLIRAKTGRTFNRPGARET